MIKWRVLKPLRFLDGSLHVLVEKEMQPASELSYEELLAVQARFRYSQAFADEVEALGGLIHGCLSEMLGQEDPAFEEAPYQEYDEEFVLAMTPHLDQFVPWQWRVREAVELDKQAYQTLEASVE